MKNVPKKALQLLFVASLLAVGCAAFSLASCSLFQKTETATVATVKDCANEVTHSVTAGILDNVSAALVCDQTAEELPACVLTQIEAIAKKAGWVAVDCAIAEIEAKASENAAFSADPLENLRARRAAAVARWRENPDGGAGPTGGASR